MSPTYYWSSPPHKTLFSSQTGHLPHWPHKQSKAGALQSWSSSADPGGPPERKGSDGPGTTTPNTNWHCSGTQYSTVLVYYVQCSHSLIQWFYFYQFNLLKPTHTCSHPRKKVNISQAHKAGRSWVWCQPGLYSAYVSHKEKRISTISLTNTIKCKTQCLKYHHIGLY
jgi:hypothetical protein